MRFLLVDNAAAVRLALAKAVTEYDPLCEIREAETIDEAVAAMVDWKPSVLFTGLGLANDQKGIVLIERVLKRDPAQVIIVCTSLPQDHQAVGEALSAGAFAYLPKPVRTDKVKRALNEYSEERGGLRRIR